MENVKSRNILKINIYAFLCGMRFSLPIVFFDLKERGFSYSEIGFFFSLQAIASLCFEIPAGTIADRFGSKWSLALSSLGLAVTYIFLATQNNFYFLCIVFMIWGIAKAFHSGADTTFIIDSLKEEKKEHLSSKVLGSKWSMFYFGLAFSSLMCPLIINFSSPIWTYFGTVITTSLATLLILTARNPKIDHSTDGSIKNVKSFKEYYSFLREGILYLNSHEIIKYLLIIAVSFSLGAQIFFQYVQKIMESMGIDQADFGFYYTVFTGTAALAARLTYKVDKKLGQKRMLLFLVSINIIVLASQGIVFGTAFAILSLIGMQIQAGLSTSIMNHYINEHIDSHNRATLNSFKTFLHGALMFLLSPLIGWIADKHTIPNSLMIFSGILLLMCLIPILKVSEKIRRTPLKPNS
jgi:MFS family permease